ncbi:MAG TPA: hypothetical protein VGG07_25120 [Solirubrobacteraceae bacterium]
MIAKGELVAYDPALYPSELFADPDDAGDPFTTRFAKAQTIDELFDALKGNTSQGLVGRRLQILNVHWRLFQSDIGWIPNAICDAADIETGELLEFATTGGQLTSFIRHVQLIGAFPFNVRITESKTRSGQTALNFERA